MSCDRVLIGTFGKVVLYLINPHRNAVGRLAVPRRHVTILTMYHSTEPATNRNLSAGASHPPYGH